MQHLMIVQCIRLKYSIVCLAVALPQQCLRRASITEVLCQQHSEIH